MTRPHPEAAGTINLETLWDGPARDAFTAPARSPRRGAMPHALRLRYGGALEIPLRTDRATLVVNFVTTLDGVVALATGEEQGGGVISGRFEPDRFVMALLRAAADVLLVGAGTIAGGSSRHWTADHLEPQLAPSFREWRQRLGLAPHPTTVIVTGSGDVRLSRTGLDDPSVPVIFATTISGAERLARQTLPAHVSVEIVTAAGRLTPTDLARWLAGRPGEVVLCEGGPHLMGGLVRADAVDEYFLTVAPQVLGRASAATPGAHRLSMVEGVGLAPSSAPWHDIVSVKRAAEHVFLRYRRRDDADAGTGVSVDRADADLAGSPQTA